MSQLSTVYLVASRYLYLVAPRNYISKYDPNFLEVKMQFGIVLHVVHTTTDAVIVD